MVFTCYDWNWKKLVETSFNRLWSWFFDISELGNRNPLPVACFWVKEPDWTRPVKTTPIWMSTMVHTHDFCLDYLPIVFKGPVWSHFSAWFAIGFLLWQDQKKTRPQKTRPNHLERQFCCNLFKPNKTEIFVVFYT